MKRVEFIGGSYVGKSTLYSEYSKRLKPTDSFLTEEMFRELGKKRMGKFVFLLRKIIEKTVNGFGGKFKIYQIPEFKNLEKETLDLYKYTLSTCFHKEIISLKGVGFANKIQVSLSNLIAKYSYYQSLEPSKIIIVEESFIHWHLALHELIQINALEWSEDFKNDIGLFPTAVIYCYADENTILERINLREKAKKINQNHKGKSHQDILQKVLDKQNIFFQYTSIASSFGVPVLQINTANSLEKNIQEIDLFLKKIK